MKKKLSRWSLVLATVLFVFAGCSLLEDEYDEELLIGTWTSTDGWTYTFNDDHSGSRTRQGRTIKFDWTLTGDELELDFSKYDVAQTEIETFKVYIVEELNETRMEAYDQNDDSKTTIVFTKK